MGVLDPRDRRAGQPELTHLVARSAQAISNALEDRNCRTSCGCVCPGQASGLGADAAGLVCVDADGVVTGLNAAAQQMQEHEPQAEGRCTARMCLLCNSSSYSAS